jgi:hypothetical protein
MHRPRFARPFPGRAAPAAAAFTLIFALLAGLACDEHAPTETRAAAPPPELGTGGEEPDLALGDITAMGTIPLPINQTIATTPPDPAFRIGQTGTGPNGIFQINNTGNNRPAVQGLTNGIGRGGYFQLTNATNSQPGLEVTTNGTGRSAVFKVTHTSSVSPVVEAIHSGLGAAGVFIVINPNHVRNALEAINVGQGRALLALQNGTGGNAAHIAIQNTSNSGVALGVSTVGGGTALSVTSTGPAGAGNAAIFNGDVTVNGTLNKSAGSFKIDHPLDPERKYLSHSFVESPDMKNVYDGTVTLDASGRASVELPEYFEALNKDFRYQLTAVGAPGPNLYIAEGVKENHFKIAGGRPYARVSWQVTGVRQDTYANEHRIKVEEDKPREEKSVEGLVARR